MRFGRTGMLLLVFAVVGCAVPRNVEVLEARLRDQEDRIARLQSQLEEARSSLKVARMDATALRRELAAGGRPVIRPEQAELLYSAAGLEFHDLLTGSLDRDGEPGDEVLAVVLTPHDEQGSLLKVPGTLELELLDLSRDGDDRALGRWQFNADEVRDHWHSGFVGSGYLFHLPWPRTPDSSKLLLHAQMTTIDGRRFDSTHELAVDPATIAVRPPDEDDERIAQPASWPERGEQADRNAGGNGPSGPSVGEWPARTNRDAAPSEVADDDAASQPRLLPLDEAAAVHPVADSREPEPDEARPGGDSPSGDNGSPRRKAGAPPLLPLDALSEDVAE